MTVIGPRAAIPSTGETRSEIRGEETSTASSGSASLPEVLPPVSIQRRMVVLYDKLLMLRVTLVGRPILDVCDRSFDVRRVFGKLPRPPYPFRSDLAQRVARQVRSCLVPVARCAASPPARCRRVARRGTSRGPTVNLRRLAASAAVAVWARSPRTARAAPRSAVSYGPSGASLRRPPGPSEPPASGGFGGVSLSCTRRHDRSTPSHLPLGGNQPAGRRCR